MNTPVPILIIGLVSGVTYALASVFYRSARLKGFSSMSTIGLNNVAMLIVFVLLIPFAGAVKDISLWPWALMSGLFFFIGQWTIILGLRFTDVSFQTPLIGSKVLMVSFTWIMLGRDQINLKIIISAVLMFISILLLSKSDKKKSGHKSIKNLVFGVLAGLGSAAAFTVLDITLALKAADFGQMSFVIIMGLTSATLGIPILFFYNPFRQVKGGMKLAFTGGALLAFQAVLLSTGVAFFGNPDKLNILYSSRVLWGWLLPVFLAVRFSLDEQHLSKETKVFRAAGAMLSMVSVLLVVL